MKTNAAVAVWCAGAALRFGDPATPVCQLFFRWVEDRVHGPLEDLACWHEHSAVILRIGGAVFPMTVVTGEPEILDDVGVMAFGAERITAGVWALTPSLNVPGLIHGFVVLYDVPAPAPWERRIVTP